MATDPLHEPEKKEDVHPLARMLNRSIECLRGRTADATAADILAGVRKHNATARGSKCYCGGTLVTRHLGALGLTRITLVYHCTTCGKRYFQVSDTLSESEEIRRAGIVKTGDTYRFAFFSPQIAAALLFLAVVGLIIWKVSDV